MGAEADVPSRREPFRGGAAAWLAALAAACAAAPPGPALPSAPALPATSIAAPASPPAPPPAVTEGASHASTEERDRLREDARAVLLALRCARCHDSRRDTALPGALRVYDLAEADWAARMTGERFQGMLRRLEGSDRQRVAAYVAAGPAPAAAGR
jgi:hypothetical protein